MEMKIGKQNLISQWSSQDSWEVEKRDVSKGIAEFRDSFEAVESSAPTQGTVIDGPLVGTSIGNAIGDASNNQNDEDLIDTEGIKSQLAPLENQLKDLISEIEKANKEEQEMRDDIAQTQEAQSNLERSAKQSSSLSDALDDLYRNIG